MTTMTSREFNQNTAGAKRAAANGPVVITDRGTPSHVLVSMSDYERLLTERFGSLADALAMPRGAGDIELDIPERVVEPFDDPFADE